jgi:hypothetical protein
MPLDNSKTELHQAGIITDKSEASFEEFEQLPSGNLAELALVSNDVNEILLRL